MKTSAFLKWGSAAAVTLFCFRGPAAETVVTILPEIAVSGVPAFGLNLGYRSSWGAEQLISNIVMNPGFEGIVDRCLVAAVPVDRDHFLDDSKWFGRSDDFWAGAEFQVRTGKSAGLTGKIIASRKSGAQGLPEFTTREPLPPLERDDRIALTRIQDDRLPTQWWIPAQNASQVSSSSEPRPGSPGVRSLRLRSLPGATTEIHSYVDAIGGRAGVLLPVTGKWRLSFWARAQGASQIRVTFGREGGRTWLDRTIAPAARWQQVAIDFDGGEDGSHGTLDLCFRAAGDVLLDDVDLRSAARPPAAFRQEVVEAIETIHPAYLRDWQGQLADTLDNRLAQPEARRASRYRPGGDDATSFGYSLPEFLNLCRETHARPWIVAPTTFSDEEWAGLGRYLRSRAGNDRFPEILVEFGNENWNGIFSAAGIVDAARHAEAALRGFRILAAAGGSLPIRPVVNAQYANPRAVAELAGRFPLPGMIAVAPYFFRSFCAAEDHASALSALFADDGNLREIASRMQNSKQELGVYEINLHTTEGDATGAGRAPLVAGAASASALATHLLDGLALGVRRQCAYVLSGFDFRLRDPLGYTPLWGLARDLGTPHRLRPTGLALELLNQAVSGDLYKCRNPFRDLTVAPFRSKSGWSVAIASAAAEPRDVTLDVPDIGVPLPARCLMLRAPGPLATNEEREQVTIAQSRVVAAGRLIRVHLPPFGLMVLLPGEVHAQ